MGADGILVTCSAFGPAIDRMIEALPIPVLKPNEAMFEAALAQGSKIGMLATFGPSIPTMTDEFDEFVARSGKPATLRTVLVPDAIDLLRKGDVETHNRLVAERAPELADCDAIMLAHFSTSRAAAAVRAVVDHPRADGSRRGGGPHARPDRLTPRTRQGRGLAGGGTIPARALLTLTADEGAPRGHLDGMARKPVSAATSSAAGPPSPSWPAMSTPGSTSPRR